MKINKALYIIVGSGFNKLQEYENPGIEYLAKISDHVDIISIDSNPNCKAPTDEVLGENISLDRINAYLKMDNGELTNESKLMLDERVNGGYDAIVICDGISAKTSDGISFSQYDRIVPAIESYLKESGKLLDGYISILFNQVSPSYSSNKAFDDLSLGEVFGESLREMINNEYSNRSDIKSDDLNAFYEFVKQLKPEQIDEINFEIDTKKQHPQYEIHPDLVDLCNIYDSFKNKGFDINSIYDVCLKKLSDNFFKKYNIKSKLMDILYRNSPESDKSMEHTR